MDKPIVQEFRGLGVEIVPGDLADTQESLETKLKHADILVNTTLPFEIEHQTKLFLAAKHSGVKRVVPSDFGPSAPPGVMKYQDSATTIHNQKRDPVHFHPSWVVVTVIISLPTRGRRRLD
ncbi:hypothetical protein E1B28_008052 [Marasmius oreades]|uniref:NmrA-like domain-containing protein n=1 Tax=Marasmius oreades TaxID=181124 RepID=A0A9P7UVJ9_9AGAR|nr:uncharacterized protein E1B28_008052 [Marasmius oreades]KAG7094456.1 hypothetical protein E1B28_008052 [Marasmius oreades]